MKRTILFIIPLLFVSCATVINQPNKRITVYTTKPSKIVYNRDTINTTKNKAKLRVRRQKKVLKIVAITDSLTKTIEIKPRKSSMFWCNIPCNYGIGMLVDKKNKKQYSYPSKIYINSADTIASYFKYGQSNNKGEVYLHLSLPHINSFLLHPKNEPTKTNTGFWGFTIGLDYYHSKNQFLSLGISGVADFFLPIPAPVDISGEYEVMSSRYISLSNNHKLRRFVLGYGISYAQNTWDYRFYDEIDLLPPKREPVKKSHNALGLIFPAYYQLGQHFNIGVVYRPTFFNFNGANKFQYEHLISIDFSWKIRLKK